MKKSFFLFPILLTIVFFACKKSDPGPLHYFVLPDDSACAPFALDSFPLQSGHIWTYDNGDTMRTVADTLINGVRTTKLRIDGDADYYMQNVPGAFKCVARNGSPGQVGFGLGFFYYYDSGSTAAMHAMNVLLAKYPVVVNDTFSSGETYNYPNDLCKSTWVGFTRITTPAGTFNCAVLKVESGSAPSWYRYYSEKGLVREIFVITFGSKVKEDPGFTVSKSDLISINF